MPEALWRGSLLWRLAALGWMVLMFWLSSRSDLSDPFDLPSWLPLDKLAHAGMFGALGVLLYLAGLRAPLAVAGAALYGVADEVHQMFVPGRSPEILDWLADVSGAALGVSLVRSATRRRAAGDRRPVE